MVCIVFGRVLDRLEDQKSLLMINNTAFLSFYWQTITTGCRNKDKLLKGILCVRLRFTYSVEKVFLRYSSIEDFEQILFITKLRRNQKYRSENRRVMIIC